MHAILFNNTSRLGHFITQLLTLAPVVKHRQCPKRMPKETHITSPLCIRFLLLIKLRGQVILPPRLTLAPEITHLKSFMIQKNLPGSTNHFPFMHPILLNQVIFSRLFLALTAEITPLITYSSSLQGITESINYFNLCIQYFAVKNTSLWVIFFRYYSTAEITSLVLSSCLENVTESTNLPSSLQNVKPKHKLFIPLSYIHLNVLSGCRLSSLRPFFALRRNYIDIGLSFPCPKECQRIYKSFLLYLYSSNMYCFSIRSFPFVATHLIGTEITHFKYSAS